MPFFIRWTADPVIFSLGPVSVRWYGLLFASGFALGYWIMQRVVRREHQPERWLDTLLGLMILGTLLGARLGHVFFYAWDYYRAHPGEILMIWQGGLASHGAAIGLFLAFWVFSRYVSKLPMTWVMDRMAMCVAFGGFFIRMGNLFNHEIVGAPTDLPWGFVFTLYPGDALPIPRHPSQLYEALAYLAIGGWLLWRYLRTRDSLRAGLLTGYFLVLGFAARFAIEFVKADQEAFEADMALNMGQWLSIPLVLLGLFMILRAYRQPLPAAVARP
ncbi:MAG: prolipoprotein diacylglyceryl transferase [Bacteroidia bacterium]